MTKRHSSFVEYTDVVELQIMSEMSFEDMVSMAGFTERHQYVVERNFPMRHRSMKVEARLARPMYPMTDAQLRDEIYSAGYDFYPIDMLLTYALEHASPEYRVMSLGSLVEPLPNYFFAPYVEYKPRRRIDIWRTQSEWSYNDYLTFLVGVPLHEVPEADTIPLPLVPMQSTMRLERFKTRVA